MSQAESAELPPIDLTAEESGRMHPLIPLLAVAAGLSVANLYYNNPLLKLMADSLGVSEQAVGIIPTITQIGYAIGMLLIVPLGDIVQRWKLIPSLLVVVGVAVLAAGFARNLAWLATASLAIGIATCVPQILIPFAAKVSTPKQRGRAVGTVMMGLLLGILLSRTLSGIVGHYFGWRVMYYLAAGGVVLLAAALAMLLPHHEPSTRLTYGELLRSVFHLVRTESVLRQAMLNGALLFAAFSAFWATLVFRMKTPPFHYGETAAGLFGLVGAAGAMTAPQVGKLATKYAPRTIIGWSAFFMFVSFGIFWGFGTTLAGIAAGVILLDVAVQGAQVSNQTRIYALSEHAHSRVNSAFMVSYFLGGAAGSTLASWAWKLAQWNGVCAVGCGLTALAVVTHLLAKSGHPPSTAKPDAEAVGDAPGSSGV